MSTALDAPPDALDQDEQSFVSKIREHGWFRTTVFGDDQGPGFSFTTGFWVNTNHPELMMFSTKDEIVREVFWDLFRQVQDGRALPIATRTDSVFANLPAYAFPIAKKYYADFLGWSRCSTAATTFNVCRSYGLTEMACSRGKVVSIKPLPTISLI